MENELQKYIEEELGKGYTKSQIINALLKSGYPREIITEYFSNLTPKHALFSLKGLLIIILLLFIILAIPYIYFNSAQKKLQDIKLILADVKMTNDELSFDISLLNTEKRISTTIDYELNNVYSDKILEDSRLIIFDKNSKKNIRKRFSEKMDSGKYLLVVSAILSGKKKSVSKEVIMEDFREEDLIEENLTQEIDTCNDKVKNKDEEGMDCGGPCKPCEKCDDNYHCTSDYFKDDVCIHEQIIPCCGNSICESDEDESNCDSDCLSQLSLTREEIISQAKKFLSEPDKAVTYCRQLAFVIDRDNCYNDIAQASKNVRYCLMIDSGNKRANCILLLASTTQEYALCGSITLDSIRDSCYVKFISTGTYSLCEKLSNEHLKETCRLLER